MGKRRFHRKECATTFQLGKSLMTLKLLDSRVGQVCSPQALKSFSPPHFRLGALDEARHTAQL
jgi:hypothetical protein